ncbi:MarR family winged helix-turn-helix transcriptional regulator [Bacillus atrophaeus]
MKRVGESRGISQKELSARADKDQATLTKILDLLEKKNFIRREANPRDRRSFLVVLTEAGEELKQTLTDKMEILFAGLLENTSDEDLAVFLGILDRINGNIANNTTS